MRIIGLCGGSGSGKGEVCRAFERLGIPTLDTDAVYHSIISAPGDCVNEIKNVFGPHVVSETTGGLDRMRLREEVFPEIKTDRSDFLLSRLNEISHKYVLKTAREWLLAQKGSGAPAAVIDAPLLFESGFDKECDLILLVTAPLNLRVERIKSRDGISESEAKRRISAQLDDEKLREVSDAVIENHGDLSNLYAQVCSFVEKYIKGNFPGKRDVKLK